MTDLELVDTERFATALETLEAGEDPGLDPREDPSLSALAELAAEIRDVERFATETPRFESYRARSRAYVLRSLERAPEVPAQKKRRPYTIPFLHWSYLAPVASAAAAALLILTFVAVEQSSIGSQPGGEQVANLGTGTQTPIDPATLPRPPFDIEPIQPGLEEQLVVRSVEQDLNRIDSLIQRVSDSVAADRPVDPELLRSITESVASVAERIEGEPDTVEWVQVVDYIHAAADSRYLLAAARTDQASESALSAARRTAQDGVVVAMNYFAQRQ